MTTTKFDPFALVGTTLFRDLNRLLAAPVAGAPRPTDGWVPRIDVAETDDSYIVRAELPGIDPDTIDVTMELDVLTISGERSLGNVAEDAPAVNYRKREILDGAFVRKIKLDTEVDVDAVSATSSNGILEVTVPKQPVELPRKVAVTVQR